MTKMSVSDYAKHRGVTHHAVQKAISSGRIQGAKTGKSKNAKVMVDKEAADATWDKNKSLPNQGNGQPQSSDGAVYSKARAAREAFNAKLAEIEYREKSGQVVDTDKAKILFFNIAKTVQQNILNIPDRISAIVAAENNPKVVHDIISHELRVALQGLADGKVSI